MGGGGGTETMEEVSLLKSGISFFMLLSILLVKVIQLLGHDACDLPFSTETASYDGVEVDRGADGTDIRREDHEVVATTIAGAIDTFWRDLNLTNEGGRVDVRVVDDRVGGCTANS